MKNITTANIEEVIVVVATIGEGTNNRYLINDGMCFVNDGDIKEASVSTSREYIVREGDTLWDIAGSTLGDSTRYVDIKSWNGLTAV